MASAEHLSKGGHATKHLSSTPLLIVVLLSVAPLLPVLSAQSTAYTQPLHAQSTHSISFAPSSVPSSTLRYWFQVGAWAAQGHGYADQFGIPVTGASVEIRVNHNQHVPDPDSDISYWVGIDLPGDSFIQVGYEIEAANGYAQWFWEYFPHNAHTSTVFQGQNGDAIGPDGTWYQFSLESSGTRWYALVNGVRVGSVDLGVTNSGSNGPYASAEVAHTKNAHTILGPVEFRNLEFKDTSGQWHKASAAVSLCCYSFGSDTYSGAYPYGVANVPGENNYWLAGSNLNQPIQEEGNYLWPWYRVTIQLPVGSSSTWYLYEQAINLPPISATVSLTDKSRYLLEGWYVNGAPESQQIFTATADMVLKPWYVKQYFVQVNSPLGIVTGSGWYNEGATDTITVNPTTIPASGILANFGVKSVLAGWTGDYNGPTVKGASKIQVNAPMTITAVWKTDYGVLPYYSLLIIPVIAVALYLRRLERKSN